MPTPTLDPPTGTIGHVDDSSIWGQVLYDALEYIPALQPGSFEAVRVYAEMRRDPQLAAILAGYTLPIRRATWTVDPAGCRPEVAALVADDLGLSVSGKDQPGAARTRGVSWREHLRSALHYLEFGHYGFELQASTDTGQARLVGLWERTPATISTIHTDQNGQLSGITQDVPAGQRDAPQISGDRLCWYVREREGSSWYGTSLLRPAYSAALVKKEILRVHATSIRRFGMGVPLVRALPGTAPTPEQMAAADRMAQSARVGETSGGALPPGFIMELVGMTGGAPDAMAFLSWLDQQMSRMALAGFLDLGETSNGSRALGESFVDLFLMSLQSTAEDIADTITRQVVAKVVAWNWGEDEPVPRVVVGDLGSRREVTAESLQLLLNSGALGADPALEEYVRREWRLPAKKVVEEAPKPPPPALEQPAGGEQKPTDTPTDTPGDPAKPEQLALDVPAPPKPVKAARARSPRRKKPAPDDDAEHVHAAAGAAAEARPLSPEEQQAGLDPAAIQQELAQAQQEVASQWPTLVVPVTAALISAVGVAVGAGALASLGSLAVPDAALAGIAPALSTAMLGLASTAAERAASELRGQGIDVAAGTPDAALLRERAEATAQLLTRGYASSASRTALLNAGPDVAPSVVEDAVRSGLDQLTDSAIGVDPAGFVADTLTSALLAAQAEGRHATHVLVADTPGIEWMASEVMDRSTCGPCKDVDEQRFADYTAARVEYPTGRYIGCLGRDRCRGLIVGLNGRT